VEALGAPRQGLRPARRGRRDPAGHHGEIAARKFFHRAVIKTFENESDAALEVDAGRADVMVYDKPTSPSARRSRPGARSRSSSPSRRNTWRSPCGKGDTELRDWLNLTVFELRASGTWDSLYQTWFVKMPWRGRVKQPLPERPVYTWHWDQVPQYFPLIGAATTAHAPSLGRLDRVRDAAGGGRGLIAVQPFRPARFLAASYVELLRNIPLMLVLYLIYFGLGAFLPISPFWASVVGLSVFEGAYVPKSCVPASNQWIGGRWRPRARWE